MPFGLFVKLTPLALWNVNIGITPKNLQVQNMWLPSKVSLRWSHLTTMPLVWPCFCGNLNLQQKVKK